MASSSKLTRLKASLLEAAVCRQIRKTGSLLRSSLRSDGEERNSTTSPMRMRRGVLRSQNPPFDPRREDTKPPHASRYKIFAVSAGGIPVHRATSRAQTGPSEVARKHRLLSA